MIVALVSVYALGILAVSTWHFFASTDSEESANAGRPTIGLDVYATGTFEVFNCIAEGDACDQFDKAIDQMSTSAPSFTYTTLDGSERTITTAQTSPEQWQQIATAVMRDGELRFSDVQPNDMSVRGDQATFTVPASAGGGPVTGVVEFAFSGSADAPANVRVTSVTFEVGES